MQLPIIRKSSRYNSRKSWRERWQNLAQSSEIKKRLLATVLVILLYRILASVPLPGIDVTQFQQTFGNQSYSDTSYLFSLFTGGSFDSPSIVGMGIAAYINASIIIQLLSSVIPALERLSKEGQRGRELINKYTRLLTLPLSLMYSVGYVLFLRTTDPASSIGQQLSASGIQALFADLTTRQIVLIVVTLTAGTILLMWLAELLTEVGIGNGMSIFISINIATTLPALLSRDFATLGVSNAISGLLQGNAEFLTDSAFIYLYLIILGSVAVFAAIVFITESIRKVPIQYARRVRGAESGEQSYLPLKLNQSGVIPVIFATSFLTMPQIIIPILVNAGQNLADGAFLKPFLTSLNSSFLAGGNVTVTYIVVEVVLILIFAFFYSLMVMKPKDVADNLQKSGGFIPGIRPGKSTERYITKVMLRLTAVGGIFLAIVAVLPMILGQTLVSDVNQRLVIFSGIGGTSLIILVGTALETYRQINSLRVSKSYERYI